MENKTQNKIEIIGGVKTTFKQDKNTTIDNMKKSLLLLLRKEQV